MESWAVAFLGVIALASFIQILFFVTLAVIGYMVVRRAQRLGERAAVELREPAQHATEALRHVKEVSAIVAEEARTIRAGAHAAAEEVREAKEDVRRVIRMPWVEAAAVAKGIARAVAVIRETPWAPPEDRAAPRGTRA
jgi:hypothetical protein